MMRIATLFSRYGVDSFPGAEKDLREIFVNQLPGIRHDLYIIDNALPGETFVVLDENTVLMGGDNRFREFSAWDSAWQKIKNKAVTYQLIHLATSAFNTLYTAYLKLFDYRLLKMTSRYGLVLGHVDYYGDAVEILHYRFQHWIRSSFVFLPPFMLSDLDSFIAVREPEKYFSDDPLYPFKSDASISRNYQEYLLGWLTGNGTGQGVQWHSRFDLSSETLPFFKQKALAIFNEQLLSAKLRKLGYPLIDVTWLSNNLDKNKVQPAWNTPLDVQIAGRSGA
jgi:hypothetical protein